MSAAVLVFATLARRRVSGCAIRDEGSNEGRKGTGAPRVR